MNLSDDTKRTIRAMQLLGFSFPPDFKRTANTLEELPVEYMLRIKKVFKENFSSYVRVMDSLSDRIEFSYCHICEKEEMAYDDIPKGWGWYDAQVGWWLMCTGCQGNYEKKFNKKPKIVTDIIDINPNS